jgi:WD40 repeat protein
MAKRETVKIIDAFPLKENVYRLAWSPDGAHLAAGSLIGDPAKGEADAVRIFDASTGEMVANEPAKMAHIYALLYTPEGKYLVESAIDQEGKYLAEKAVDFRIRIWDGGHQNLLQEVHGTASSMAVTRDGRYLAMGGDKKILIWELK